MQTELTLRAGGKIIKGCRIWVDNDLYHFATPFFRPLSDEIKALKGARWNPELRIWTAPAIDRNTFQVRFLMGENPYERYDAPLVPIPIEPRYNKSHKRIMTPLKHQPEMVAHFIQRRHCIEAGEMGTTKTFCCITALEIMAGQFLEKFKETPPIWYVAPRSALRAVEREFLIWGSALSPVFMTYENLVKRIKNWEPGTKAPPFVVLDEASKAKTGTSQRAQACQAIADAVRSDWAVEDSAILLMSGTPAPKSPSDWYSLCEIACPGFIREGDIYKFNNRLAIIVKKENFQGGGVYPSMVAWRDDERKCNVCGKFENDPIHDSVIGGMVGAGDYQTVHPFVKSENEVLNLYKRLKGLVMVHFKKDCLDLPEKVYRPIHIKPNPSILRAASLITKAAKTTIEGLTRLRELSDGFQYIKIKQGKQTCKKCNGLGKHTERPEIPDSCPHCKEYESICLNHHPQWGEPRTETCDRCGGTCEEDKFIRSTKQVPCPKDQILIDLLDEVEETGRIVIYAGFTAAIDRCVEVCQRQGWHVIRIDSGMEQVFNEKGNPLEIKDYITLFQDRKEEYPRVAFIAHPGSAGMGLTLTASSMIVYYSNDFNGENRAQSEDRIHRPGMDVNRGATIVDIIHLPSDQKVLDNLKKKRNLQLLTLGELLDAGDSSERIT